MDVVKLILNKLFKDIIYFRKYFEYIDDKIFENEDKDIVKIHRNFFIKNNKIPSKDDFLLLIETFTYYDKFSDRDERIDRLKNRFLDIYSYDKEIEYSLLCETSEKYIKDCFLEDAIIKASEIYEEKDKYPEKVYDIPEVIKKATSITFDDDLGIEFSDFSRYDNTEYIPRKFPFYKCNTLNILTQNGIESQTMNIIAMATNGGKTRFLTWLAQGYLKQGLNVVYITLEMPEWKIYRYIDASFFGINIDDILKDDIKEFKKSKHEELLSKNKLGKLYVKKYPARTITPLVIENYINRLMTRDDIKIDILIIDYLQLLKSYTAKNLAINETHHIYGELTIECRNMSEKFDMAVWSGSQFNREGADSTKFNPYNLKGSTDIANSVDFMLGGYASDDDLTENIIRMGTMKTRYNNKGIFKNFILGVDADKMTYFDYHNKNSKYDEEEKRIISENNGMENLIKNIKHKKHKIKFKEKHKLIKDESNDIDEMVNIL